VIIGKDTTHTAMSITVGTPLAIATKLLLTGQIKDRGVIVPTKPSLYSLILNELENYGVKFIEKDVDVE
jgi:saccharopine dehydrogenase-like NADP-dependent oxidoreductase